MMKMKTLAAAIAFAAAGTANAAIELANTGDSSLVLSVWDTVAQESYVRDLGLNLSDVAFPTMTPAAGLTINFAADPVFSSLFGNNVSTDIFWNVTAADSTGTTNLGRQILSTATLGAAATQSVTNAGIATAAGIFTTFFGNANAQPSPDATTCTTNASCWTNVSGDLQYAGDTSWGKFWGQSLTSLNSAGAGGLGQSLGFYSFTQAGGSTIAQATKARYENAFGVAAWTLAADGSVSYSLAGEPVVPEVPVPAAAWLLGSGVIGLVGVARRRTAK